MPRTLVGILILDSLLIAGRTIRLSVPESTPCGSGALRRDARVKPALRDRGDHRPL
jgi:hypothetical protein